MKGQSFAMDESRSDHVGALALNYSAEDIEKIVMGTNIDREVNVKANSNTLLMPSEEAKTDSNALMQALFRLNELLMSMLTSNNLRKEKVYFPPYSTKTLSTFNGKSKPH